MLEDEAIAMVLQTTCQHAASKTHIVDVGLLSRSSLWTDR